MLSLEESLLTEFSSNVETDHHEIDKAKLKVCRALVQIPLI